METNPLLQQIADLKKSIIDGGHLVKEPSFAEDKINSFLEEAKKHLAAVEETIGKTPVDHNEIKLHLSDIRELCYRIGATKMELRVNVTRESCNMMMIEEAKSGVEQVKNEMEAFKAKLDSYFELVKHAKDAS